MTSKIYTNGILDSSFDTTTRPSEDSPMPDDFDTTTKIKPSSDEETVEAI